MDELLGEIIHVKIESGASFCHVASSKQLNQEIEVITCGNQKWSGAAPNLRIILIIRIVLTRDIWGIHEEILARSIRADPRACARKYLIAPSDSWFEYLRIIIGINDNIFNSIEAHTISQLLLDIAIKVLENRIERTRIVNGEFFIRVWRSLSP